MKLICHFESSHSVQYVFYTFLRSSFTFNTVNNLVLLAGFLITLLTLLFHLICMLDDTVPAEIYFFFEKTSKLFLLSVFYLPLNQLLIRVFLVPYSKKQLVSSETFSERPCQKSLETQAGCTSCIIFVDLFRDSQQAYKVGQYYINCYQINNTDLGAP